MLWKLPDKYHL